MPITPPVAPASRVLAMIAGIAGLNARALPPLKPIQPIMKKSMPSMAKGKLLPGISRTSPPSKRPSRGPTTMIAASATQPPRLCTTVLPAKSTKPRAASQPGSPDRAPPQARCPNTG